MAARAGARSTSDRSYPTSEVSGGWRRHPASEVSGSWEETPCVPGQCVDQEELPCIRGQGQWGGNTPRPRSGAAARRSYPSSEVRGGQEELPCIRGQGRPVGDTPCPRPGAVTLRSHPEPKARGSSWEEPPMLEARVGDQEEHPEGKSLGRHRRA